MNWSALDHRARPFRCRPGPRVRSRPRGRTAALLRLLLEPGDHEGALARNRGGCLIPPRGLCRDGLARPGGVYGIAGFTMANLGGRRRLADCVEPGWPATLGGILAGGRRRPLHRHDRGSRSYGIYFLMITLAVDAHPSTLRPGDPALRLRRRQRRPPGHRLNPPSGIPRTLYIALITSAAVYLFVRYLARTPSASALAFDDLVRMRALGYNVPAPVHARVRPRGADRVVRGFFRSGEHQDLARPDRSHRTIDVLAR